MKRLCLQLSITGMAVLICMSGHKITASQGYATLNDRNAWVASANSSAYGEFETGNFILYESDGGVGCRAATADEAVLLSRRDRNDLHSISPIDVYSPAAKEKGLQIVLRATQQLENFPEARAAFLKAAAIWTDKIQSPLTIVIDVDFGPTNFGQRWGAQVLGSTSPNEITSDAYRSVRAQLIAGAPDDQTRSIYDALPLNSIVTDLGGTTTMRSPSANARALGLLDPVADPDGKEKGLGKPPSIGFNNTQAFDFDPGDGIDSNKVDFEAVAVHEIGHALGFMSSADEVHQGDNKAPISVSVWDLFRVRPGSEGDAFSTATRILRAGGEPMFTAAGLELPLSTGQVSRGGDGRSVWHWKDDQLIGNRYIGIMEPGIGNGKRQVMTANDLLALKLMGYKLKSEIEIAPEIGALWGRMDGDTLLINGLAVNIENDTIEARVKVLDDFGEVLGELPVAEFEPGEVSIADIGLQFSGINQWPGATQASLTLVDRFGNRGGTLTSGILKGDSGGPNLVNLSFDGSVLRIKAKRMTGALSLEVNGVQVSIATITQKGEKKAQVVATAAELQLKSGPNRVRVVSNGLRSNAVILDL